MPQRGLCTVGTNLASVPGLVQRELLPSELSWYIPVRRFAIIGMLDLSTCKREADVAFRMIQTLLELYTDMDPVEGLVNVDLWH
ncbi:unnamed protein product [Penicillium roqueforti FM164]|uniref:Genomic scaffold, ProqFM164S02 n=1 Tax=Penicillium roqueforti (strain FM164) TaxID=1365484 RepID=W6Q7L9_PENRF|nr:unnamed protein product [Penicillium roqueforti FM164]